MTAGGWAGQQAVVGVAETDYVRGTDELPLPMILRTCLGALADAGLGPEDVDGIIPPPGFTSAEEIAAHLGIEDLRYSATVHMGGASPVAALQTAAMAVACGVASVVLVTVGWNGYSAFRPREGVAKPRRARDPGSYAGITPDFYVPYGLRAPAQLYSLYLTRYKELYGVPEEAAAAVALACRRHAQLNPKALMRGRELTLDDYLASPFVAEPLRKLDCCLETDCAATVVVTTLERARDLPRHPIVLLGAGMEWMRQQYVDAPRYEEVWGIGRRAAAKAFGRAGLGPSDVDIAQLYDINSFEVARQFEALGFCDVGEGTDFASATGIGLDGKLPTCTDGGLLACSHIGWGGPTLKIVEAVRQLRGEAGDRQVPGAELAIAAGAGSGAQYYNVAILGRAR